MLQNNWGYFNLDIITYTIWAVKHLENDFANIRINKELWFEMPQTFFILNGIYVNKNTIALNHRTRLRSDLTVHIALKGFDCYVSCCSKQKIQT